MTDSDVCAVCGDAGHDYPQHLGEAVTPGFVRGALDEFQEFEQEGTLDQLIDGVKVHVDEETTGGEKAWGLWLINFLEKILEADKAPDDVVAEAEDYLKGQQ